MDTAAPYQAPSEDPNPEPKRRKEPPAVDGEWVEVAYPIGAAVTHVPLATAYECATPPLTTV